MNCASCGHTHTAHKFNDGRSSRGCILFAGEDCMIDGCGCVKYVDKIELIDEDLV